MRRGASNLLSRRCWVGGGRGRAVFHAIFEAFDSATQVAADAFEFFGTKNQNNNQ